MPLWLTDALTLAFRQASWDFVKIEVMDVSNGFFEHGTFIRRLNTTFVFLIPKKGGAKSLGIIDL